MKVLVDAVGCTLGGIATYEANLLSTWVRDFPNDDVRVLLATDERQTPGVRAYRVRVRRPVPLARPVLTTRAMRRIVASWQPDAVLALRPATTLLRMSVPLTVVVHDLRHELRPEQFSSSRRALRRVGYTRTYAVADGFLCISRRTLDDLRNLHVELRAQAGAVVHHGADHVDHWSRDGERFVVAFGHHTNKNVDLTLRAWRLLVDSGAVTATTPLLNVLGLSTQRRIEVAARVSELGLGEFVTLSEYLDDAAFEQRMASAAMILYPSDFEGFGLPVVEAMRLGVPVVVGPDPAVQEVSDGHAFTMCDWSAEALANAVRDAMVATPEAIAAAREHAATFTWSRAVRATRTFVGGVQRRS